MLYKMIGLALLEKVERASCAAVCMYCTDAIEGSLAGSSKKIPWTAMFKPANVVCSPGVFCHVRLQDAMGLGSIEVWT